MYIYIYIYTYTYTSTHMYIGYIHSSPLHKFPVSTSPSSITSHISTIIYIPPFPLPFFLNTQTRYLRGGNRNSSSSTSPLPYSYTESSVGSASPSSIGSGVIGSGLVPPTPPLMPRGTARVCGDLCVGVCVAVLCVSLCVCQCQCALVPPTPPLTFRSSVCVGGLVCVGVQSVLIFTVPPTFPFLPIPRDERWGAGVEYH